MNLLDIVKHVIGKIDFNTIALLFCLMAVVQGFTRLGYLEKLSEYIVKKAGTLGRFMMLTTFASFFLSMLVTNDVALIILIPFTIGILYKTGNSSKLIKLAVLETIGANLGSMSTPIGNPQNVFLYGYYKMNILGFFKAMLPFTILAAVILFAIIALDKDKGKCFESIDSEYVDLYNRKYKMLKTVIYSVLLVLCLVSVLGIIPKWIVFVILVPVMLGLDYRTLRGVNYGLLTKFIILFVAVGLLGDIEAVKEFMTRIVNGHEVLTGILSSQALSNVPSAIMLSGFTSNGTALLTGVNIGGLGTLIASMASVITYNYYAGSVNADKKSFIIQFTLYNLLFLAFMVLLYFAIGLIM